MLIPFSGCARARTHTHTHTQMKLVVLKCWFPSVGVHAHTHTHTHTHTANMLKKLQRALQTPSSKPLCYCYVSTLASTQEWFLHWPVCGRAAPEQSSRWVWSHPGGWRRTGMPTGYAPLSHVSQNPGHRHTTNISVTCQDEHTVSYRHIYTYKCICAHAPLHIRTCVHTYTYTHTHKAHTHSHR